MVKILIDTKIYNIKDVDFIKLREAKEEKKSKVLSSIKEEYPVKGYIDYIYKE
jgi:hypothetical protein